MHTGCRKIAIGKGGQISEDILAIKFVKPQCVNNKGQNGVLYSFCANAFGKMKNQRHF